MTINKVDIVYTWVDGTDPVWQEKKQFHLNSEEEYQQCKNSQIGDERYIEHNELKYSLRSICKYAPWVNHIYIITDNQIPHWLKKSDKITIIDHKDIIPEEFLPTFNSSVIESFLHKIPNLADHFIYFNDDMLIGRSTKISDFFKNEKPRVFTSSIFPSRKKIKDKPTYNMLSIRNSRDKIKELSKTNLNYGLRHGIRPINKSNLIKSACLFNEELQFKFSERFRLTPFSLLYLYTFYEIANNRSAITYQKHLKKPLLFNFFPTFIYINNNNIKYFSSNFEQLSPLVFCINETDTPLENLPLFSNGSLSEKSEFEL
ncbi:stealth family protein [Aliivibrio salmonicida]|uniref:stealth family protein n=1 Tax=Aliivibrio salmonicida TaxID=40269 RepID=UPI003D130665